MVIDSAKAVVLRFNRDVIEQGDRDAFEALMAPTFINRSAPPGAASDGESMWNTFNRVLRPAIAGLTVTIHDQIQEGDKVTTRKTIAGSHDGPLLGIEPTGKPIRIEVIDIVRVENGCYAEHWGINTLPSVLESLRRDEPSDG
ncbi:MULTISPECIES: ester cyclase [unclassified Sphingomonas]|uniref:ester cyclase n=1 Tax=unclassified Sphingomonas TaxID=196159 RepID=UPI000E0FFB84|nr:MULTISPECIES: ester cyclase [unclassified Sphingomonas]AXJ95974.1 ester cyclase [Sphingomonas sp. FARSPH]